jgi:hypothetical protein
VTEAAIVRRRDMITRLGGCDTSGMAGRARFGGCRVVKSYSREAGKVVDKVTSRTISGCRYVIRRQSYGPGRVIIPIMAGDTIVGDTHVVKNRRNEFNSRVTNDTILDGRQVIKGLASAAQQWKVHIVVARNTVTNLTCMIIEATGKGTRGVAKDTIVCSRHMVERHAFCFIDITSMAA